MGTFRLIEFKGIRATFWLQWIVVSIVTATAIGPLSTFLASNLIVAIAGWETFDSLTSGGEYSSLILFIAFSALMGLLIGVLEWFIIRRELPKPNWFVQATPIFAFTAETSSTALAFNLLSVGLYVGFIPLCCLSLFLWGLGVAIPLTLPLIWKR